MYRKVYLLRSGRYLFGPEILRNTHMDLENIESVDADAATSATDGSHGDASEMLTPDHGLFQHLEDLADPYESMFLQLGAKHEALDLDEDDEALCDFYVDYRIPTIMHMQRQQQQQRTPHMMFRQQLVPRSISNSFPDRSRTAEAAQQAPLPPPLLIKTPGNTELDRLEQPNNEELSSPVRESPWVDAESSLQRPPAEEAARDPDEDQLFEHLVTTMAMPRRGSLGSLARPIVKRLRSYFKHHVPKCPQCGTSEKVAFRYFNNFKKTTFLQPRYICKHPRHPIAISKREFACPTASQIMRAHCLDDPRDRFGALPDPSSAYRSISYSHGDAAGLHLRL